jgi:hypothetical protein
MAASPPARPDGRSIPIVSIDSFRDHAIVSAASASTEETAMGDLPERLRCPFCGHTRISVERGERAVRARNRRV